MLYQSTRSTGQHPLSFQQVLFEGLSSDGGLFIPCSIPTLLLADDSLDFCQVAYQIFRLYISQQEISDSDLKHLIETSFATFSHPEITPVRHLTAQCAILELFHGPTFAFKDVALQFVGNCFDYFLSQTHQSIHVLGATSGDTGGAAIAGLKGKRNVDAFILHPKDRISSVQRAQMTSVLEPNIHNIEVNNASFDNCQEIVKRCFSDREFKTSFSLAAVNSINWARILAQISYYYYSYLKVKSRKKLVYAVPTGNFGDILAGYYALRMGLPIDRLIVATNSNDILHRFFQSGTYLKQSSDCDQTLSPAMDILVSSNFERLLWYLVRGDTRTNAVCPLPDDQVCQTIALYMEQLKTKGGFSVSLDVLKRAQDIFCSHSSNDEETLECIGRYYHQHNYLLDPHTACGILAMEYHRQPDTQYVCLSTASPGKFPEAVLKAVHESPLKPPGFELKVEAFTPKPLLECMHMPKRCLTLECPTVEEGVKNMKKLIRQMTQHPMS